MTDTYFVVAHLHYVLVGANVFPVFAAFYYWLPKMTGRLLDERLGRWSFWIMFTGFNLTFFPMQILGLLGMPRRIYTYPAITGWGRLNMLETVGTYVLTVGILISVWNFFVSLRRGALAGPNPWNADSLEWDVSSPPPVYGLDRIPTVVTRHPLWDEHDEHLDPDDNRSLTHARVTPVSGVLDAVPWALAKMPGGTLMPPLMALGLSVLFAALLVKAMWLALAGVVACLLIAAGWLWPEPERSA